MSQSLVFEGSPGGARPFTNVIEGGSWSGRGTVGAEYLAREGIELKVEYTTQGQYRYFDQAFTGRVGYRFNTGG